MRMQPVKKPRGQRPKHSLVLNPFTDLRCSRCIRCRALNKVRKVPLLIHIDPRQLMTLRMSVKLCPNCDLLVVHQDELEAQLAAHLSKLNPQVVGNAYFLLGTVDVVDHRQGKREPKDPLEMIARHYPFKERLELRVSLGGWFPEGARPPVISSTDVSRPMTRAAAGSCKNAMDTEL
jgi:hypothetical protein